MDFMHPLRSTRLVSPGRASGWSRPLVATVASVILLAACGSSDSATADTLAGTGAVDTTPAEPAPAEAAVTSATEATPAPATQPAPVEPPSTEPAATAAPVDQTVGGYESAGDVGAPTAGDGKSDPIVAPLVDGTYWSWNYASDGSNVTFTLSQLFVGDACREQFAADENDDTACASDNNTLQEPSATVTMPAGQGAVTVLTQNGEGGFARYRVSPEEFARLVAGSSPASDAPAGFSFSPEGVSVRVSNGQVVAADQIFIA